MDVHPVGKNAGNARGRSSDFSRQRRRPSPTGSLCHMVTAILKCTVSGKLQVDSHGCQQRVDAIDWRRATEFRQRRRTFSRHAVWWLWLWRRHNCRISTVSCLFQRYVDRYSPNVDLHYNDITVFSLLDLHTRTGWTVSPLSSTANDSHTRSI